MYHPFHNIGGRRIRQQVGPRTLPLTFISIWSLTSSVMSKWRCGSHHTEPQQSTFPGDSWLAHPVLRRVVTVDAYVIWMACSSGMNDSQTMTFRRWRGDAVWSQLPWPHQNTDAVPSARWNISLHKMVCVVSHWNGAASVVERSFLTGDGEAPFWMCLSHYHPVITSTKLYLRLIQHCNSTAAVSHASSTWKQQKDDFCLIFAVTMWTLHQTEHSKSFEI